MVDNLSNVETIPENYFCPSCNVHMNIIKISQPLDPHQQYNVFSLDGIKEQWYPIDRLQTFCTNLYQTVDHSSERLLQLSPCPVLNTDPTLDNLNYSNASSRPLNSLGK